MAKYVFVCTEDYQVETPGTILETRLEKDGAPVKLLEVPAHITYYKQGQKVTCYNKKDAAMYRGLPRWREEK
jgi:hypothetical protein